MIWILVLPSKTIFIFFFIWVIFNNIWSLFDLFFRKRRYELSVKGILIYLISEYEVWLVTYVKYIWRGVICKYLIKSEISVINLGHLKFIRRNRLLIKFSCKFCNLTLNIHHCVWHSHDNLMLEDLFLYSIRKKVKLTLERVWNRKRDTHKRIKCYWLLIAIGAL